MDLETGGSAHGQPNGAGITINALLVKYLGFTATHYRRPDGSETSKLDEMKRNVTPMAELYGSSPAAEFGPLKLKAVRDAMLKADFYRTLINQFESDGDHQGLLASTPCRRDEDDGRSGADSQKDKA